MLNHLKRFWEAISTGWVVEYPGRGGAPRDFFDRRDIDRRPMYVDPNRLPSYQEVCSSCRRGENGSGWEGEPEGGRELREGDPEYEYLEQRREEEEREDAVLRWHEQMRKKSTGQ